MYVDIDWLESVKKRLNLINSTELKDITWLDCGVPVTYSEEVIEEFKMYGLNNTHLHEEFKYNTEKQ